MENPKTLSSFVRELVNLYRHKAILLAQKQSISQEIADCNNAMNNLANNNPYLCNEISNKCIELDGYLYNIEIFRIDPVSDFNVTVAELDKLKID